MPSKYGWFRGHSGIGVSKIIHSGRAVYRVGDAVSIDMLEPEFSPTEGDLKPVEPCAKNFANGADLINVVVDAGAGPTWQFRYLSPEDAKAAVEGAHRLAGRPHAPPSKLTIHRDQCLRIRFRCGAKRKPSVNSCGPLPSSLE